MKLTEADIEFLKGYDVSQFERPSVTADTVLFRALDREDNKNKKYPKRDLEVLLIKRKNPPYGGGWALPGGFCDMHESLKACAARELEEETGLKGSYHGQIATFSNTLRDPRTRNIGHSFLAVVPNGVDSTPVAGDDAADAAWFKVSFVLEKLSPAHYRSRLILNNEEMTITGSMDLIQESPGSWTRTVYEDAEQLAFDHLEVISCAIECLRSRIYQSTMAFEWVEETFRLADLQSIFEAVVEHELLRTTFFEHIKPMLRRASVQPDENSSILDQLYEYNQDYCIEEGMPAIDLWLG